MNFGLSMEGIPSRGGPPKMISFSGTTALERSNPFFAWENPVDAKYANNSATVTRLPVRTFRFIRSFFIRRMRNSRSGLFHRMPPPLLRSPCHSILIILPDQTLRRGRGLPMNRCRSCRRIEKKRHALARFFMKPRWDEMQGGGRSRKPRQRTSLRPKPQPATPSPN